MQDSIFNLLTEEQANATRLANHFWARCSATVAGGEDFPTAPAVRRVRACVDNEEPGYPPLGEDSLPRATAADN